MRQLWIQVPKGVGEEVVRAASSHEGINLVRLQGTSADSAVEIVVAHVSNGQVEGLLDRLEAISDLHVSWLPSSAIALRPPMSKAQRQMIDVQQRSPIEILLAGLQSIGSWWGFLSYAAIAAVVVWVGLYTNSSFLLTASMLIAPFAGPAMNTAIATARGDVTLLWHSLWRYFSALGVCIATSALLSVLLQQQLATQLMIDTGQVSSISILLPLAAGAAGAIFLVQSQSSSLVSGAAVGVLVAASLAPPTGLTGMAIALGEPELVKSGIFLLLLQLAGINLSAALVFRWRGLSPNNAHYKRGRSKLMPIVLVVTALVLAALLSWQFSNAPFLQRSSRAQRINTEVQDVIKQFQGVRLIESTARFPNVDVSNQTTLLVNASVQQLSGDERSHNALHNQISQSIRERLKGSGFDVTPLIDVTVFDPPGSDVTGQESP
ncbi:MAG: DUF389 domain-containing protein [Elainellaceae cyanobacterium]